MMHWLWSLFVEPLSQQAFQKALIGGSLVAIVCGVIGCFVILRRMAFLGDALAHAMLAGVTAGYLFMQMVFGVEAHAPAMLLGSLMAGMITVLLIGFVSRVSRIKDDTAIGIMYTGIFAVGGILASFFSDRIHIDLYHFVTGMVLGVEDADLWMMAIVAALVLSVVVLFFRQFQITAFDPIMAASVGIPVLAFDYLLTACTSLVVVSAVSLVGVILVVGLLVTPAATAYLLCDRLGRMQVLAALFGITGVAGGLFVSTWIGNIATGPSIVLVITLQFLVVLAVAPRYGLIADWLRRRNTVPQELIQDVLGCFRKGPVTLELVNRYVDAGVEPIRRAVRWLEKRAWIERQGSTLRLTKSGRHEARRLLRAHRLWETYLKQTGLPPEQLHARAHELEHIYDEAAVDYLDDKLGHPLTDPHGSEIPEDFVHLVPGRVVKASLLREGHSGIVESVPPELGVALVTGGHILMGPRSEDGLRWQIRGADGQWVELDHRRADALLVRLDAQDQQAPPPAVHPRSHRDADPTAD